MCVLCVSMLSVNVCVSENVCACVSESVFADVWANEWISLRMSVWMSILVSQCVPLRTCLYVSLLMFLSVRVFIRISLWMSLYLYANVSASECLCVYLCMSVYAHAYIYVRMHYVCIYSLYASLCVWVSFAWVFVSVSIFGFLCVHTHFVQKTTQAHFD